MDGEGTILGGASVEESIRITQGPVRPRVWLPLVSRN
jgi:hypothetical protein